MHLLYCDETNLESRSGDFLIYGGLFIPSGQARALSDAVSDIRTRHGVPREYRLKFNPGPKGFSHPQFIAFKQEIFECILHHEARLIVYVVLHDIAKNSDEARRNGINTVCYHFNCILNILNGSGLVLIDRFNDEGNAIDAHLRDKFTIGLTNMPFASEMRLDNIVGFHYSTIGQSHFPSLIDVVLGSLRFAVNAHTRCQTENQSAALNLLRLLGPLFWRPDSKNFVPEIGFMFSPKTIKVNKYLSLYTGLKTFLASGGIEIAQQISDQRTY